MDSQKVELMFIHIVFFKFKNIKDCPAAKHRIESMIGKVQSLQSLEVGIDVVRSGRSWDMVLDTRFKDQAGYEAYAKHPIHLEVLKWLKQAVLESATVDYLKER